MKLLKIVLGVLLTFSLCTALPGCGGGGSSSGRNGGNGDNGDAATYKYFAYISNGTKISVYPMDYAVGTLSASTGEYSVSGGYPIAVAQHPSKPYLYITTTSYDVRTVRVLSIEPATGGLTEIQSISSSGYEEIEITPDGKYLYTAGGGPITCYAVSEDGKLAKVGGNSNYPTRIRVAPDGKALYATYSYQVIGSTSSSWSRYLQAYDINANGTLASRTRIDFVDSPYNIAVFGQFVYTAVSNKLYQFNSGTLLNQNSTIDIGYGSLVATRGYLYAATDGICGFSINASTGTLTELSSVGSPYATGTTSYIRKLSVDPGEKYLYALDEDNKTILGYSIASNGALSKLNWDVTVPDTPRAAFIAKVRQ